MTIQNLRLTSIVVVVAILLLIPYAAMQVTGEVKWTGIDFLVAAVLLLGAGLACEVALRLVTKLEYRVAVCAAILLGLVLVWAELAVGIFGTRFAGS
ncbi:MAG: hypothetical protein IT174_14345 [Acidobacteria bacterium]|nr:hypothetical protein [Acidobacteriota bacterium]